ncbi:hypothetical protein Tco_1492392 [Tanacetum coccineum]
MMTYLKHAGGKKHSDLKTKNFEEIQVLYEKVTAGLECISYKQHVSSRKKVLVQMLELKLESEEDNTAELEPENSDGNEKDL